MNKRQRATLIGVAVIILAMLAFPPFYAQLPTGAVGNMGYSFLWEPPNKNYSFTATVNTGMLFMQWLGILIVGGMLWLTLKSKE